MVQRIVIACDSFKGCLNSGEVASAVAEGVGRAMPEAETIVVETGDGGEGTGKILTRIMGGATITTLVTDPLGRLILARYGIAEATAIIEMAQASGLTLLKTEERNPLLTSTYGTGEMILDALKRGCRRFLVCIGGSATNDGGTGMLEALGFRFIDRNGSLIEKCCGGKLSDIAEIDRNNVPQEVLESEFIVACDVTTPFCGPEGAARVFAAQKGADEETIEILEEGIQSFAKVISSKYGINLNEIPGTGAAGGLGGAFKAFLDAELKSGIDMVLDAQRFDEIINGASLVITGEGKIDFQSSKGKVIDGICRRCSASRIPVMAIAGIVDRTDPTYKTDISQTDPEPADKELSDSFIAVHPIGPEPQNESDLEYAMRPEVACKNISNTIARELAKLSPSLFRENL